MSKSKSEDVISSTRSSTRMRERGEIWESPGPSNPINDELIALLSSRQGTEEGPGTSVLGATFLIVNAALGAALLNFPQAFNEAGGIVSAIVVQAILLVFIVSALLILARCSDLNNAKTLQEVMYNAGGKRGQQLASFVIALYCFGTCIAFLIIIGDQYDRVFSSWIGTDFCHYWYMDRRFTIIISSVIFILPLCYSKRIDFLKYASFLGVFAVIYIVGLIIYKYYSLDKHYVPPLQPIPKDWTDIFLVVPAICFGYQCHVSTIPIYSCMEKRKLKSYSIAVIIAIALCVMAYTLAAIYGYMTFGTHIPSDILEGYDAHDWSVLVGIIAMGVKNVTTYPILLFCGREATSDLLMLTCCSNNSNRLEKCRRYTIATIWFIFSVTIAVLIPNIEDVIKVLGSLAAVFIFVFPGVCLLQHTLEKDPMLYLIKHQIYIIFSSIFICLGAFLFGITITQALMYSNSGANVIKLCV